MDAGISKRERKQQGSENKINRKQTKKIVFLVKIVCQKTESPIGNHFKRNAFA